MIHGIVIAVILIVWIIYDMIRSAPTVTGQCGDKCGGCLNCIKGENVDGQ